MKQQIYTDLLKTGLKSILAEVNPKRIFLVTGKQSFSSSGTNNICEAVLKNYEVVIFNDLSINPKIEDIEKGIDLYNKTEPDLVIAIGGGSVIDTAKSINALAHVKGEVKDYAQGIKKIEAIITPLVAVPTTAGTGSEATHFAVIYVDGEKYSLAHSEILPRYVILDSRLTFSQTPYITACSGLDALAQAIESMWSTGSTEVSKEYANEAMIFVNQSLYNSVHSPNENSRQEMQQAAFLAGKAINISKTTASHAMSYALTSNFGIPHGHAVALTLGATLEFNSKVSVDNVQDERGVEYVKTVIDKIIHNLGVKTPIEARDTITSLVSSVGLETKLSELGVVESDVNALASAVSSERAKNNPRFFDESCAAKILKSIL